MKELKNLLNENKDLPPAQFPVNPLASQNVTCALYNGMIHAYIPFAIRGAIWYQGEANYRDGMRYVDKTKFRWGCGTKQRANNLC